MEVDGGSESGGGGFSEELEKSKPEGEPRVKRKMKTPSQLEILEKTYAVEAYPSEALRAGLSVKLGLSDRQLQMWFCHRRLKDRKPPTEKRQRKTVTSSIVAGTSASCADEMVVSNAEEAKEHSPGLSLFGNTDSLLHQQRVVHKVGTAVPRLSADLPAMRRLYEPPLAVSEQRAIAFVEVQLGEPLREDGPILGMEFDPLPPGAFGSPIVASGQEKSAAGWSYEAQLNERLDANPIKGSSKALHEYQFLPEKPCTRNDLCERALPITYYTSSIDVRNPRLPLPTGKFVTHINEQLPSGYSLQGQLPGFGLSPQQGRQIHHQSPASGEVDIASRISPLVDVHKDAHYLVHPTLGLNNQIGTPDRHIIHDELRMERKRKNEEARIAKEAEAQGKRIQKELEKQNMLRRKREEQLKKEIERKDRERHKEEERILREKQREEARHQREQRREMERREKFLQKEYIRAEKMKLKEEIRREKEAVRLKAAYNRAVARRIAKESMDLIEDERLELMELVALSRGLPSILALDAETIQNLDLLKDQLPEFPPNSVHLKRPFGIQSWTDKEENVGNFIMVWKFLITFADVLGIWPFTLDEFIQTFYDSDSRLLEEIHIALLRCIIKDIEDLAKAPATTLGGTQNYSATAGGGHLQIVEGAYSWGFDVRSWSRHLSPLTWAEVLRQFSLAAGFGPKLKKQDAEPANAQDENEINDGAEIISNLRSGLAAENAVTFMQERGFSNPRKSRHRLTPGTVKFAAFHILSLVGSEGLSIVEVAEKIQKSGLRDLTTSKTPEASISAALSRDTKLFERTAPSTYCVRSPFRKDPADAESILTTAREKIKLYHNGNADGDEVEEVEKEDAEQDQDSESDAADDPEADDSGTVLKQKEYPPCEIGDIMEKSLYQCGKENCSQLETPSVALGNVKCSSNLTCSVQEIKSSRAYNLVLNIDESREISVIDEEKSIEPWVQTLTEGEYADLSIEERLNALVALIGVANEGNAIRLALEERLEAANALKKQMWAEAQVGKRRMKEEHTLKLQHSSFGVEDRRTSLPNDVKNDISSTNLAFQVDLNDQHVEQSFCNDSLAQDSFMGSETLLLQQSAYAAERSRAELKAFIGHRAEEMYVYRSLPLGLDRRRNRYWQLITSPSRNDPCSGRIFVELCNGVWRLVDSEKDFDALLSSLDVRGVREYQLHSMLLKIESSFKAGAVNNFSRIISLKCGNDEVKKEFINMRQLDTDSSKSLAFPSYSDSTEPFMPYPVELVKNVQTDDCALERYKDFEKWMWEKCFASKPLGSLTFGLLRCKQLLDICRYCRSMSSYDEDHCPSCLRTNCTSERAFNVLEHDTKCNKELNEEFDGVFLKPSLPLRIRLLKAQLAAIEASIPREALKSFWSDEYRKYWGMKLWSSTTATELLETLTMLEDCIKRGFLCKTYRATCELLNSSNYIEHHHSYMCSQSKDVALLPWIPQTTSAVALRLMELDSSIYYTLCQKEAYQKDSEAETLKVEPNYASPAGYLQPENNCLDPGSGNTGLKRGRGRPRGPSRTCDKTQKMVNTFQEESSHGTPKTGERFGELPIWKGGQRARGGSQKGRRSARNRQKPVRSAAKNAVYKKGGTDYYNPALDLQEGDWDFGETPIEGTCAENASSSEGFDFDEEFAQASGDEYNDLLGDFSSGAYGKSGQLTGSVNFPGGEVDEYRSVDLGDGNDEGNDDQEDEPGDCYVDGYFNSDYHGEANQSTGGMERTRQGDSSWDRGSVSSSSDCSY